MRVFAALVFIRRPFGHEMRRMRAANCKVWSPEQQRRSRVDWSQLVPENVARAQMRFERFHTVLHLWRSGLNFRDFSRPVLYNIISGDSQIIKKWKVSVLDEKSSVNNEKPAQTGLLIYPNPTEGKTHLHFAGAALFGFRHR